MHAVDVYLFQLINATSGSPDWLLLFATFYSKHFPAIAISAMLLCLVFGSNKLRKGVVCCLLAMAIAWCLTRLIRWGFPLERPYEMGLGTRWIQHSGRPRFPSMHATVSFAFAHGIALWCVSLSHYARIWKIAVWSVAILMGWSRIYIGVHLPFDVVGGIFTGVLSVYLLEALLRTKLLGKFAACWSHRAGPWAHRK